MSRIKFAFSLVGLWTAIGVGTYFVLLLSRSSLFGTQASTAPDSTVALINLPGSMYVEQNGDLYRLQNGHFTKFSVGNHLMQITGTTSQGPFVAVASHDNYSDLVQLDSHGAIKATLTHDQTQYLDTNQWVYWPRLSVGGGQLFYSTDNPKYGYQVDFSIWSAKSDASQARQWTQPNAYTGGDTAPVPLKSGSLLYAGYAIGGTNNTAYSQLLLQKTAFAIPSELTTPDVNCNQPAISADQKLVAMVCSNANSTKIEEATFDGTTLGPLKVLVDNCQCAWPTFAPDGSGIAYLAPSSSDGPFQLWWLAHATPGPVQVTNALAFDGASAPLWLP